jgi:RNA polymerase primary sigma factor
MAKYRIDDIAGLARQLEFTPTETRSAQLAAAEDLLHSLQPEKAYPLEFVIYRITGYRPKDLTSELLTGLALQHDLGLLIERVSDTLNQRADQLAQPVLSIDDLCDRFGVTSKTIQRWRRKGLPARRFIFPDGKRRVGFLLSSVERFLATHQEQVSRGTNFSQVDDTEREQILRRARRLATCCRCCVHEISRRIARKHNRSPLTILHTIRKHDQEHPDQAIFPAASAPMDDQERQRVLRAFKRGVSLYALARRTGRPRSAIYRVVLDDRLARLQSRKIRFIDDPLYHQADAREVIDAIVRDAQLSIAPTAAEQTRVPRDLPPYLAELYRVPLLTPAQERALFLKFNFHKFQFVQARRRLDPELARARDLASLESHLRLASQVKREIVRANLRLVVSVARKHLRPGLSLTELISDGTLTLMRAVDSFDIHRGFRFSTYATLALMKGFARSVPQMLAAGRTFDATALIDIADPRLAAEESRLLARDEVGRLLERLNPDEVRVLRAHYGLDRSAPATFDEVAAALGMSKQRIRRIEQSALEKLRIAAKTKVA